MSDERKRQFTERTRKMRQKDQSGGGVHTRAGLRHCVCANPTPCPMVMLGANVNMTGLESSDHARVNRNVSVTIVCFGRYRRVSMRSQHRRPPHVFRTPGQTRPHMEVRANQSCNRAHFHYSLKPTCLVYNFEA